MFYPSVLVNMFAKICFEIKFKLQTKAVAVSGGRKMYWPVHNSIFISILISIFISQRVAWSVSCHLSLLGFFKLQVSLNGFLQIYPRLMYDKVLLHSRSSLFLKSCWIRTKLGKYNSTKSKIEFQDS